MSNFKIHKQNKNSILILKIEHPDPREFSPSNDKKKPTSEGKEEKNRRAMMKSNKSKE
jgi:hypothetical protein